MANAAFAKRKIEVDDLVLEVFEAGSPQLPTILFLHGYPETSLEFEEVFRLLEDRYHLVAVDLPGIGHSTASGLNDKLSIAKITSELIKVLNLNQPVLVGHDAGGMATYAFIRNYEKLISKAVIICTAIPGVEPWETVKNSPFIWHFKFFAVPELPEKLIEGKQAELFDYFYNTIAHNKSGITQEHRQKYAEAYATPAATAASLGWYRSFPEDEKENATPKKIAIPVLYLRGEKDFGKMQDYLDGFHKNGLSNIVGKIVPESGHFAAEENPKFVAEAIHEFVSASDK